MIKFCNYWVIFTLVVFYLGPIDWASSSSPIVGVYVLFCLALFNVGALVSRGKAIRQAPLSIIPTTKVGAYIVVTLYSCLNLIYVNAATGKSVTTANSYSLDYGQVYADYQSATTGITLSAAFGVLLMIKSCLFPLALVVFVHRFKSDPILGVVFLGPMVISSFLRGTDLEIIDIVAVVFSAAYLHGLLTRRRLLLGVLLVVGVLELFLARRVARFGGDLPACLPDTKACFNPNGFVASTFGERAEVLTVFIANYVTNGYQGMAYATELPWHPNWGFGHLPTLGGTVCNYVGTCPSVNYQTELTATGWNSEQKWTTAYTVIANDLSFLLVPLFAFYLGVVIRRCLSAWEESRDPAAGAGAILIVVFWLYSSANMHLGITLDWAVATVVLLYVAPWRRARIPIAAAPAAPGKAMTSGDT